MNERNEQRFPDQVQNNRGANVLQSVDRFNEVERSNVLQQYIDLYLYWVT